VRFSNKTLCAALVEQTHLVAIKVMHTTTPRRRCIRLQSFNSSGKPRLIRLSGREDDVTEAAGRTRAFTLD
jgi:hypothetical protein